MTRRNLSALAIAAIPCALGLVLLSTHSLDAGSYRLVQVGGTIRSDVPGEWFVIGGHHLHTGIGAITCRGGVIHVALSPAGVKDGWANTSPDNVYAHRGLVPGLSVSPDEYRIQLFRDGDPISCADPYVAGGGGNIWVDGTAVLR